MSKVMLINAAQPEEIRVAVMDEGQLDAFFVERKGKTQLAGNIYKARVVNVEPSLQAAFVDLGSERNGFLHASDIITPDRGPFDLLGTKKESRTNGPRAAKDADNPAGESRRGKGNYLPIARLLSRGQELLVQITREGLGTKGATLTTYLSLPGKFMVLMPAIARHGVSKKITDEENRKRLRRMLSQIEPPQDMGVIIRTAGLDASEDDLRRDLDHLLELWQAIQQRVALAEAPCAIYLEGDLVVRAIRDNLTPDTKEILIDDRETFLKARDFLQAVYPGGQTRLSHYRGSTPLFHKHDVEHQLDRLIDRHVQLASGASIIIEQTEAMITIDVNSGRFRRKRSNAATILAVNLEAAREIGRQLRLRDIGGLVLIDFIDMEPADHRQQVEDALREALAADKARTRVVPISLLGVLEMTRQRVRPSLRGTMYTPCPHCGGTGTVRSRESTGLDFIRILRAAVEKNGSGVIQVDMSRDTALYVANKYRKTLAEIESHSRVQIEIRVREELGPSEIRLYTTDESGKTTLFDA